MQLAKNIAGLLNIRARMLLVCLGVAAPLLALGGFAVTKEYRTLKNEAQRATTFQVATAARTLSQWLSAQNDAVRALSTVASIQSMSPEASSKVLSTELQLHPNWIDITLLDNHGALVSGSDVSLSKNTSSDLRSFVRNVAQTARVHTSELTSSPVKNKQSILVGAPVMKNNHCVGVLIAAIEPKAVWGLFSGLGEKHGNIVAVCDSNNKVICRSIDDEYWQGRDFSNARTVKAAQRVSKGTIEGIGIVDSTPRAYAFERVPNGWLIEVGVPTAEIYGGAHDWLILTAVVALIALAVSVLLALWATSHFTKTINVLVREALAIGRGDLSKRVNVKAGDELGLLARAFNEMAARLETTQDQKFMVDKITESIRHSLDLDDILNTAVREMGLALESSRVCLALVDNRNTRDVSDDELVFNYVWWDEERQGMALQHRSIVITQNSLMSTILEQGSILSLDVLDDRGPTPLFENSNSSPDDWRSIRSLIACPIVSKDGPLGLILVHQCDRLRLWTETELELVEAVTRQVALAMEHARLYTRTKQLAEQEMLINHIVRSMRSSLDLDTILNTVTKELGKALKADRCQIAQPRREGPLVITHEYHQSGVAPGKGLNIYPDTIEFHPNLGTSNAGRNNLLGINLERLADKWDFPDDEHDNDPTLREAPLAVIGNVSEDSRALPFKDFLDSCGARSLIAAPLLNENRLIGVLVVQQCSGLRQWTTGEVQLVAAIADQVAIAITQSFLFAQVKHQAITDGLTGLYNHIYFKNRLKEEVRTAQRKGTSCSLIMVDLDKLKVINDTFGHPIGDAAIRQVASILKTLLRSGDTAARYGGEEFGVILPETSLLEAALIADRLCAQIRNTPVPGLGNISASMGAAAFPKHASSSERLVELADKALYEAKNNGRDQVRLYEPEEQQIDFPSASTWITNTSLSNEIGDARRDKPSSNQL